VTRRHWLLSLSALPAGAAWATVRLPGFARVEAHGSARAEPGSTLKPLLANALEQSAVFRCGRTLTIRGRRLDCTHPPLGAVNLADAICHSCNSYFAQAAARTGAAELRDALAGFGLSADFPRQQDEQALLALGLWGLRVSPAELATAYARLSQNATRGVRQGLERAAEEGTAAAAQPGGLPIAGKTGTAQPHAWFAGWAPRERPALALAVYVPSGRGMTEAAPAAREILERWLSARQA
jgi:cell division protein FtsI/penicillin-binding protein 2